MIQVANKTLAVPAQTLVLAAPISPWSADTDELTAAVSDMGPDAARALVENITCGQCLVACTPGGICRVPHPAALLRSIRDTFNGSPRVQKILCRACEALLSAFKDKDSVRGSRLCYDGQHCRGDLDAGDRRRWLRPREDLLRDGPWLQAAFEEGRDYVAGLEVVSGGATPGPNWQLRSSWPGLTLARSFPALEELVLADLTVDCLHLDKDLTPLLTIAFG